MNTADIQKYVIDYLEATGSHIYEKSNAHVTVKLSPEADRALTNRPYYWNFVERTGADPETMTFTFIFDQQAYETARGSFSSMTNPAIQRSNARPGVQGGTPAAGRTQGATGNQAGAAGTGESILSRYFGIDPGQAARGPSNRPLEEQVTYGCGRLRQIFEHTRKTGKYTMLYEQNVNGSVTGSPHTTASYHSWLCVNYKVELACDMKRSEIHSLGIHLSTGEIVEQFHERIEHKPLSPKLPANAHIRETISLSRAALELETHLEKKLIAYDHSWAAEAMERYHEEYSRIESYYTDLLETVQNDEEKKEEAQQINEQFIAKIQEIERQYKPKVLVSVINCGIFHLFDSILPIGPGDIRQRKIVLPDRL